MPPHYPFQIGDDIDLSIINVSGQGLGFGFYEGFKIFVPLTLKDERINATIETITSKFIRARCNKRLIQSPQRATPPCPHFGTCGGCQLQHLTSQGYTALKQQWVAESINRAGFSTAAILPLYEVGLAKRRRVVFKITQTDGQFQLGFFQESTHHVVDIHTCLIVKEPLLTYALALKEWLPHLECGAAIDEIHLTYHASANVMDVIFHAHVALSSHDKKTITDRCATLHHRQRLTWQSKHTTITIQDYPVTLTLGDAEVSVPPLAFLQATHEAQTVMTDFIMRTLASLPAASLVYDLYSGCGTFSFPL